MTIMICDCETTGVGKTDKAVEVGVLTLNDDLTIQNEFESLVDPEKHIPFGASAVHHILDKHVTESPTIEELFDIVWEGTDFSDVTFVAHNAAFDTRFLSPYMNITGTVCTLRAAKRFYPDAQSHKLMALAYMLDLDLPHGEAHRALYDVKITRLLLLKILEDSGLTFDALKELLNKPQRIETMSFGKWKGKKLSDIPPDYLRWMLKQDNLDSDLRWSLQEATK